jgi:hypothetical protein
MSREESLEVLPRKRATDRRDAGLFLVVAVAAAVAIGSLSRSPLLAVESFAVSATLAAAAYIAIRAIVRNSRLLVSPGEIVYFGPLGNRRVIPASAIGAITYETSGHQVPRAVLVRDKSGRPLIALSLVTWPDDRLRDAWRLVGQEPSVVAARAYVPRPVLYAGISIISVVAVYVLAVLLRR